MYADVATGRAITDLSFSVVEDGRVFGVRCCDGVIVTYTTKGGLEVSLEIGSGAWDE